MNLQVSGLVMNSRVLLDELAGMINFRRTCVYGDL